jgi:catechol 2,3-dioxygenase-like lactoylglutathione lyase family enzyme
MQFRLYHVGISVADLDAMTAWYAETEENLIELVAGKG